MKMIAVLLEPRMVAQHRGKFETVKLRHAHVDENDGDIVLEKKLQGLPRG